MLVYTSGMLRAGLFPLRKIVNTQRKSLSTKLSDSNERTYFLKRLGLKEEDIQWPEKVSNDGVEADYWRSNPHSIRGMYSSSDLSKVSIFQGGYINFGCWPDLSESNFTAAERTKASEFMYKEITEMADMGADSEVLDVGCGIGYGCQYVMKRYYPKKLVGLDITPEQIERAKRQHQASLSLFSPDQFSFVAGDATAMPLPSNSLTHVISVEAAQHFSSVDKFIQESKRVLKPSGKLVFTTFFATNPEGRAAIKALIPDHATHCSDLLVGEVMTSLTENLRNATVKSIGESVWPGLERWLKEIGYQNQWTMLWPALYRAGFIDYFVFKAESSHYSDPISPETKEAPKITLK